MRNVHFRFPPVVKKCLSLKKSSLFMNRSELQYLELNPKLKYSERLYSRKTFQMTLRAFYYCILVTRRPSWVPRDRKCFFCSTWTVPINVNSRIGVQNVCSLTMMFGRVRRSISHDHFWIVIDVKRRSKPRRFVFWVFRFLTEMVPSFSISSQYFIVKLLRKLKACFNLDALRWF